MDKDSISPSIYTVVTYKYIKEAIISLESAKSHGSYSNFFIFLVDIKKDSLYLIDNYFLEQYQWIKIFSIDQLCTNSKQMMEKALVFHSPMELCSLSKYIALEYIISLDFASENIIYIDSDCYFFNDLKIATEILDNKAFLCTPHNVDSLNMFAEREIIQAGWINSGFFIVNKKNKNLNLILKWLIERLYKLCFMSPELGIYCDQTWLTYMVQIFDKDSLVLKDPGYNVSYWNITNREFSKKNSYYYINGKKLIFFHFSGFSSNLENKLSNYSNFYLSENTLIKEIFEEYKTKYTNLQIPLKNLNTYPLCKKNLTQRIKERSKYLGLNLFGSEFKGGLFSKLGKKIDSLLLKITSRKKSYESFL